MSSSAEVRDLKKCLPALNKLQKDYIKLVEDENEECVETLTSYSELIDELKKHVKKESMKLMGIYRWKRQGCEYLIKYLS